MTGQPLGGALAARLQEAVQWGRRMGVLVPAALLRRNL